MGPDIKDYKQLIRHFKTNQYDTDIIYAWNICINVQMHFSCFSVSVVGHPDTSNFLKQKEFIRTPTSRLRSVMAEKFSWREPDTAVSTTPAIRKKRPINPCCYSAAFLYLH